jgi:transcriptional regulator with XRE-family HTH domain
MDWKLLIAELQKRGFTQPEIAARCDCGQATISDLASGNTKEPRHSLGESLRRLHKSKARPKAKV